MEQEYFQKLYDIYDEIFITTYSEPFIFLKLSNDKYKIECIAYPILPENIDNNNKILDYGDAPDVYREESIIIKDNDKNIIFNCINEFIKIIDENENNDDDKFFDIFGFSEFRGKILLQPTFMSNDKNLSFVTYIYR
jgi:hypothetical protein